MSDTTARTLELLSLLQARRIWSGRDLMERLATSERTLRRDVDRLRSLGYEVVATTGPHGGYQLRAGEDITPLLLDDEEAVAIAIGLRTAAGGSVGGLEDSSMRALAKLEHVLPTRVRNRVRTLQQAMSPLIRPWVTVEATILVALAQACRDHERMRFGYVDRHGETSARNAEPHHLVSVGQRWYLLAFDRDRDDWRTFRVDRIDAPKGTRQPFAPRAVPGGDPVAFVAASLGSTPRPFTATVVFHGPADTITRLVWGGEVEALGDDRCRWQVAADSQEWLTASILWTGCPFTVEGPPELRTHLSGVAGRLADALA